MARPARPGTEARTPLTRDRVLRAAVTFADEGGIGSLSMRKLGEVLGVEAMSLYNHVANKDELLDGMIDLVFGEIELPPAAPPGKRRCESGRSPRARRSRAIAGPSA